MRLIWLHYTERLKMPAKTLYAQVERPISKGCESFIARNAWARDNNNNPVTHVRETHS